LSCKASGSPTRKRRNATPPPGRRLRRAARKGKTAPTARAPRVSKGLLWGAGLGAAVLVLVCGVLVLTLGRRTREAPAGGVAEDTPSYQAIVAEELPPAETRPQPGQSRGAANKPVTVARAGPGPGEL